MHLSSFGLISLDGSVTKLEPGLEFAEYQLAMSYYSATLALHSRVHREHAPTSSETRPQPNQIEELMPAAINTGASIEDELFRSPRLPAAASLV